MLDFNITTVAPSLLIKKKKEFPRKNKRRITKGEYPFLKFEHSRELAKIDSRNREFDINAGPGKITNEAANPRETRDFFSSRDV